MLSVCQVHRCAVFAHPVKKNTRQVGSAAPVMVLPGLTNLPSAAAPVVLRTPAPLLLYVRHLPAAGRLP